MCEPLPGYDSWKLSSPYGSDDEYEWEEKEDFDPDFDPDFDSDNDDGLSDPVPAAHGGQCLCELCRLERAADQAIIDCGGAEWVPAR